MTTLPIYEALDAEELFRVGLQASNAGDSAGALNLLKLALQRDSQHARASWLLGAEYAQLGMMERAQAALEHAVQIDPKLTGARFQLGLLHLTSGNAEMARETWRDLDTEGEDNPYRLFKDGMLLMAVDAFDSALEALNRCVNLPMVDAALKRDVELVIEQIRTRRTQIPAQTHQEDSSDPAGLLFLSAYRNNPGG